MGRPQDLSGSAVPQTLDDSLSVALSTGTRQYCGCLTAVAPLHSAFGQHGFSKPSFSKTRRVIT
ncbi:MAG: hypothetical protein ACYTX0_08715 [Nostoc sp.]